MHPSNASVSQYLDCKCYNRILRSQLYVLWGRVRNFGMNLILQLYSNGKTLETIQHAKHKQAEKKKTQQLPVLKDDERQIHKGAALARCMVVEVQDARLLMHGTEEGVAILPILYSDHMKQRVLPN